MAVPGASLPCFALVLFHRGEKRSAVRLPPRQGVLKVSPCEPASVFMGLELWI